MSVIVVDASIGVKWFVPEVHSAEARQWRSSPDELHTLAVFFDIEIGNVCWKKVQRGEITRTDADQIVAQLPALPLQRHAEGSLISIAFDLAVQTQRTVYDCMYLSLAVQLGGRMLTADQRLFNSLMTTGYAAHLVWVEDLAPAP